MQIKTANPLGQATISVVVFTSLCAREAIKGGLSPDIAYAVGDAYIQNMVEAKTLLLSTNETIATIASQLRYCSSTYFSETFRRLTGQLPSDYRKSHGSTC